MRILLVAACLLLLTAALPSVDAARDPVGGCGEDVTVEVCFPVCVTTPCNPYVCVRTSAVEPNCVRP
jgi:hypothetical protein